LCLVALVVPILTAQTASAATTQFGAAMQAASQTHHVPLPLIEATAYVNTQWEWIAAPARAGGVGPMNIRPSQMNETAALSGHNQSQISSDLQSNLDAGAALLAHYHASGRDLASWRAAVTTVQGPYVAKQIYEVLQNGATRTTSTGETITLAPQVMAPSSMGGTTAAPGAALTTSTSSTDYPPAAWVPADPSNYSVANRAHDYPIDMIIIHDIEGSYGWAIQLFQQPGYGASAHYVTSYQGQITQMVREKDIAWHAGNWDYNTRSIGIEHEGFASQNLYTTAEYNASAALAASICSRWGVPMDRTHVIGHNEVPDPNNPGLYGGSDHHTDPGPYWNWTYYMAQAQADAAALPSPPHMMPDPVAVNGVTSATVSWQPARTCHLPITGYTVVAQPGGMTQSLAATATSATFNGLQIGTSYTFSVTAVNGDGQDTATSNPAVPGNCTSASLAAGPASPQPAGTQVQFAASSTTCTNPQYQFWLRDLNLRWTVKQPFGGSIWTWDTSGYAPGMYEVSVWANRTGGDTSTYQAFAELNYSVLVAPCANATISPSSQSQPANSVVNMTASSSTCFGPRYAFWVQYPDTSWQFVQGFGGPTFSWNTAGIAPGAYTVHAWVNTSGNSYDSVGSATVTLTDCTSATVSPATSTQPAGSTVTLTANSTGCASPRYAFWVQYPGGAWYLIQTFGGPTFNWNTSGLGAGTYTVHVWVNSQGNGYSAIGSATVTLASNTCTAASLTPPSLSQAAGSTLTFTASSTGCTNPRYAFWVQYPDTSWNFVQDFGGPTFNWNTAGLSPGTYTVHVWVNQSGNSYDAVGSATATLTGCTSAALSPSSGSAAAGTTITFTASSGGCTSPRYAFWVQYPGGAWYLIQTFGGPTFTWNTAGLAPGTYNIHVWVNTQGNGYDTIGAATFSLT